MEKGGDKKEDHCVGFTFFSEVISVGDEGQTGVGGSAVLPLNCKAMRGNQILLRTREVLNHK